MPARLQDKLAELGAQGAQCKILPRIAQRCRRRPMPQPADAARPTPRKIEKNETLLDWKRPAAELERAVRAFRPAPGAAGASRREAMKIWRARVAPGDGDPGTVLEAGDALPHCLRSRRPRGPMSCRRRAARRMNVRDSSAGGASAPGMRLG